MAEKEEGGRDWEVVSLTASAYAASPGPKQVEDLKDDEVTRHEAETSHPLYMSRHFVFPPSEHNEKIAAMKESEIFEDDDKVRKKKKMEDFGFSVEQEQETGSHGKEDGDLMTLKGLDELTGLEFYEEKGKEENIYNITAMSDERGIGGSHDYEQKETIHEPIEPVTVVIPDDVVSPTKADKKKKKNEEANADPPPCEAWWKRSAACLISQAKETNTVWSIFVAAAVMGIMILGKRWQQEKLQILQLKWESSIGNEKAGRLIGPISRLKQAFIGSSGQRRDSFIRVSTQNDS